MSWRGFEFLRRWLLPAAGLAIAPKCALCLLAYAGFGGVLGLGGRELCGETPGPWSRFLPVAAGLVLVALCMGLPRCRRMILIKP